ncbi:hypothetical protein, partial [Donghicola tyrosinivorans]
MKKGSVMLEKWYWVAGIVAAVVAVISLFVRSNPKNSVENRQSAKVSGRSNTERWSAFFDQFAAALSYSIGFISGGNLQVRSSS